MFYKKYPKLVEKLENRYKEYNDTVDKIVELEKSPHTLCPVSPYEAHNDQGVEPR